MEEIRELAEENNNSFAVDSEGEAPKKLTEKQKREERKRQREERAKAELEAEKLAEERYKEKYKKELLKALKEKELSEPTLESEDNNSVVEEENNSSAVYVPDSSKEEKTALTSDKVENENNADSNSEEVKSEDTNLNSDEDENEADSDTPLLNFDGNEEILFSEEVEPIFIPCEDNSETENKEENIELTESKEAENVAESGSVENVDEVTENENTVSIEDEKLSENSEDFSSDLLNQLDEIEKSVDGEKDTDVDENKNSSSEDDNEGNDEDSDSGFIPEINIVFNEDEDAEEKPKYNRTFLDKSKLKEGVLSIKSDDWEVGIADRGDTENLLVDGENLGKVIVKDKDGSDANYSLDIGEENTGEKVTYSKEVGERVKFKGAVPIILPSGELHIKSDFDTDSIGGQVEDVKDAENIYDDAISSYQGQDIEGKEYLDYLNRENGRTLSEKDLALQEEYERENELKEQEKLERKVGSAALLGSVGGAYLLGKKLREDKELKDFEKKQDGRERVENLALSYAEKYEQERELSGLSMRKSPKGDKTLGNYENLEREREISELATATEKSNKKAYAMAEEARLERENRDKELLRMAEVDGEKNGYGIDKIDYDKSEEMREIEELKRREAKATEGLDAERKLELKEREEELEYLSKQNKKRPDQNIENAYDNGERVKELAALAALDGKNKPQNTSTYDKEAREKELAEMAALDSKSKPQNTGVYDKEARERELSELAAFDGKSKPQNTSTYDRDAEDKEIAALLALEGKKKQNTSSYDIATEKQELERMSKEQLKGGRIDRNSELTSVMERELADKEFAQAEKLVAQANSKNKKQKITAEEEREYLRYLKNHSERLEEERLQSSFANVGGTYVLNSLKIKIKEQRSRDEGLLEYRFDKEISRMQLLRESCKIEFSETRRETGRHTDFYSNKISRLKAEKNRACALEKSDNSRYYAVINTDFSKKKLPKGASRVNLLAMRDQLTELLRKRDILNRRLQELYSGAEQKKTDRTLYEKRLEQYRKGRNKEHKKLRDLDLKIRRHGIMLKERKKLFFLMNVRMNLAGKISDTKYLLKKGYASGSRKKELKRRLKQLKYEKKRNGYRIKDLTIKSFGRAKRRHLRNVYAVISLITLVLLSAVIGIGWYYRLPISTAIVEKIRGFLSYLMRKYLG